MRKILLIAASLIMAIGSLSAQDYNFAVGMRAGFTTIGPSVKVKFDQKNAVEIMSGLTNGVNFNVLYERHMPIISKGFNLYYGLGGNIGSWKKHGDKDFTVGADVIVGLEYQVPKSPIVFSADYKPGLNFIGHTGVVWNDLGLSVRFVF